MDTKGFETQVESVASLADRLRRRLYQFVVRQREPVSREAAAQAVGVPKHVAASHLDRLEQDGLLTAEFRRPEGRSGPGAGRPTKLYRRSGQEFEVSVPERRYVFAGRLMAGAIARAEHEGISVASALHEDAAELGRQMGEDARARVGDGESEASLESAMRAVLEENGYEPRDEAGVITLANCPFHSLAQEYTDLVCGMNFDLIRGLADGMGTSGLEPRLEPAAGRCCVVLRQAE